MTAEPPFYISELNLRRLQNYPEASYPSNSSGSFSSFAISQWDFMRFLLQFPQDGSLSVHDDCEQAYYY